MRFHHVSYLVENVAYPEFESTGALSAARKPEGGWACAASLSRAGRCGDAGELPQVQHGAVVHGRRQALPYLKMLFKDDDAWLAPEQRADVAAYCAMIDGPLRDAVVQLPRGAAPRGGPA